MKDHRSFLKAAVQVAYELPRTHFLLAGRDISYSNHDLTALIPADLQDRFILTGERTDVDRLMRAMDVFAITSAWGEAFPNVLGEAMASGLPCVTTDVGDSREIIGDAGFVVPPGDYKQLAQALLKMLQMAPEHRVQLGETGRLTIEKNYTLNRIVHRYAQLYRDLVGSN